MFGEIKRVRCWSWGLGDFFWGDISKCLLTFRQGTDDRLTETNKTDSIQLWLSEAVSSLALLMQTAGLHSQVQNYSPEDGWFTFILQRSIHLAGPSRILYPWSSLLNLKAAQ